MLLIDQGVLAPDRRAILEKEVLPLGSLQEVVRWVFALRPPGQVSEVVVQDEFSHDVVMQWHEGLHLAFDTT